MPGPIMPVGASGGSLTPPKSYTMGSKQTKAITNGFGPGQSYFEPPMQLAKIAADKYVLAWDTGSTSHQLMQIEFDSAGDITFRAEQTWTMATAYNSHTVGAWDGNRIMSQGHQNVDTHWIEHWDISSVGVLSNRITKSATAAGGTADYVPSCLIPINDDFFIIGGQGCLTTTSGTYSARLYRYSDMAYQSANIASCNIQKDFSFAMAKHEDNSNSTTGTIVGLRQNGSYAWEWFTLDYTTSAWGTLTYTPRAAVGFNPAQRACNAQGAGVINYIGNDIFVAHLSDQIAVCRWDGTTFTAIGTFAGSTPGHLSNLNGASFNGEANALGTEIHGWNISGDTSSELPQSYYYCQPYTLMTVEGESYSAAMFGASHTITDVVGGNINLNCVVPDTAQNTMTAFWFNTAATTTLYYRKFTES